MPYRDTWVTCEKCGKQFIFTVEEQRRMVDAGMDITPPSHCPDCLKEKEMGPGPHEGVVKWFDPERGYGFIVQRSGEEIFFHRTGITSGSPERFSEGTQVTYLVEESSKGPQAVEVSLME